MVTKRGAQGRAQRNMTLTQTAECFQSLIQNDLSFFIRKLHTESHVYKGRMLCCKIVDGGPHRVQPLDRRFQQRLANSIIKEMLPNQDANQT
jgi:hypothetical protein